jgi:hypothetical protein
MLRSRKNVGKYNMACYYGCCRSVPDKKIEKRIMKRKEKKEWQNDN